MRREERPDHRDGDWQQNAEADKTRGAAAFKGLDRDSRLGGDARRLFGGFQRILQVFGSKEFACKRSIEGSDDSTHGSDWA
jgi:hypothetical protein